MSASQLASQAAVQAGQEPELFVYYRVASSQAEAAQAAFAAACADAGIRLLRRADEVPKSTDEEALQTWMEVYPVGLTGWEPQIADAMRPWVSGERHIERFVALLP